MTKRQPPQEPGKPRRNYLTPRLVDYGAVEQLTKGGGPSVTVEADCEQPQNQAFC